MVPHKSRQFRAILDLSYSIKLSPTDAIPSVNSTSTKLAPAGSINQLRHSLNRLIHAFATAPNDAKYSWRNGTLRIDFGGWTAKRAKSGTSRMSSHRRSGTTQFSLFPHPYKWDGSNLLHIFAQLLRQHVMSELHMRRCRWVIPPHTSFYPKHNAMTTFRQLSNTRPKALSPKLKYVMEVFVDDFITLAIPMSQLQLDHLASAVMHGIHDVFPPDHNNTDNDPISQKKT